MEWKLIYKYVDERFQIYLVVKLYYTWYHFFVEHCCKKAIAYKISQLTSVLVTSQAWSSFSRRLEVSLYFPAYKEESKFFTLSFCT